jgi:GLPGLI family protein
MKTLFIVAGLATTLGAAAQSSEGKITYERKMNMHKNMPPEAEQFKAMVPEFQTSKMELSFKGDQSLYKTAKTDEDELPSTEGGGGGGFRMFRMMAGGDAESFKNYQTGIATDVRELGPKKYLLDDTLQRVAWKLSSDTMTILGHLCHKATAVQKGGVMGMVQQRGMGGANRTQQQQGQPQQPTIAGTVDSTRRNGDSTRRNRGNWNTSALTKDQNIVAWYADDIASPAGPDVYYGLPGVIMQMDIGDGFIVYTPLEFSASAGTVKAPTSGKKITREEYYKMVREQAESMRAMGGGRRMGGPM